MDGSSSDAMLGDASIDAAPMDAGQDSATTEDAGRDATTMDSAVDATMDAPNVDAGVDSGSDAGADAGSSSWPTTRTDFVLDVASPPANVLPLGLVETSGGHRVALWRTTTAGLQCWVSAYDPGSSSWETPRLLAGGEARLAASDDAVMVIHTPCDRDRCRNGPDIYAERYVEGTGWEAAVQLDDLDMSSPFVDAADENVLYRDVVGDGAGGFLAVWNHQSGSLTLYREFTGGAWEDPIGELGDIVQPGYHFVGHAPRRYVGMRDALPGNTRAVVDGVLQMGTDGSQTWGETLSYVRGNRVFFHGRQRGQLMEAAWNGTNYDWTEVSNSRRRSQDRPLLAGQGEHVVAPFMWSTGSSGFRIQVEAMVRHDQSGTNDGIYGWTHTVVLDSDGVDDHDVPAGAVDLPDGALIFIWEGSSGSLSGTIVDWDLLAVRIGFDSNDQITVSEPVMITTYNGTLREVREMPFETIREGDDILIAFGYPQQGLMLGSITLDAGAAVAGIEPGMIMPAADAGRFASEPVLGSMAAPSLLLGDFSAQTAQFVALDATGGETITPIESTAPADPRANHSTDLLSFGTGGRGMLLWGRLFFESSIASIVTLDGTTNMGVVEAVPDHEVATGWSGTSYQGRYGVVSTFDVQGSTLPDAVRLHAGDHQGLWSSSDLITSEADWILFPQVVGFGDGFVALWLEAISDDSVVRGAIHTGSGDWGAPFTLDDMALSRIDGRVALSLSANEDAVVAVWLGASSDLQTAVLTDLSAGFDSPSALRTDTAPTPLRLFVAAGPTGHVVAFREENGSMEHTYKARVYRGGAWSTVDEPFGTLTAAPDWLATAADGSGLAMAYANDSGVQLARYVGGVWTSEEVMAGTAFEPYSPSLMTSEAGLRVSASDDGSPPYRSRLHNGATWGAEVSFAPSSGLRFDDEDGVAGVMNHLGDAAFLAYGDEGDNRIELVILRSDGTVEPTLLGTTIFSPFLGVTPSGGFLVAHHERQPIGGALELHVEAGF